MDFKDVNPCATFWTFLSILVFFYYNFACVYANCINFGSDVYFYWNFNIPPSFPLINLFCTRYKKVNHSAPFGQKCPHWNPLKLLFLIAVPFNCKIMQFLLIGFHSVGKASKFYFLLFFTRWCYFFQVWSIKQILTLFLFSASEYYRANWINNAAIIVWVCWYRCQSVVCMCVIKKSVCVHVICNV